MHIFSRELVSVVKTVPLGREMDIPQFLPSVNAVKHSINKMAYERCSLFFNEFFPETLATGGGMSIDGLKNNLTGVKCFDFVVCWYDIGPVEMLTRNLWVTLGSLVIFFEE